MREASTSCGRKADREVRRIRQLLTLAAAGLAFAACKREERDFRLGPPHLTNAAPIRVTDLQPGPVEPPPRWTNGFEENAYALSEGKRMFTAFNCQGCHGNGGGGMGPPLLDGRWIYGGRPEQIYSSIMQGRPNGMPAFGGKLWPQQAWQLTAYVRSLSGQAPFDAAPGRTDHLQAKPPEHSFDPDPAPDPGPRAPAERRD